MEVNINVLKLILEIAIIFFAIWFADLTLNLRSRWFGSKGSKSRENKNKSEKSKVALGIKQYAEDRRYERDVLYPLAKYKAKLFNWDFKDGICVPDADYIKLSSEPFTTWAPDESLYFSNDEKANLINKESYIDRAVKVLIEREGPKVPLIHEEE